MAANKFATMLHKNTHKIIVILVYAVLEWILIVLLLLNSLFGYCITKFAKYFGLKPPCPLCTRVDHVLEPGRDTNSYRDLICDAHATEVSKLSFCSNHGKLAESHLMCEDCFASRPNQNDESIETRKVAFITWVSTDKVDNGDGEVLSCCSCCKRSMAGKLCPPYMLIKPSWDILNSAHKGSLILESVDYDTNGSDQCREPSNLCSSEDQAEDMVEMKINNDDNDNTGSQGATDQHHMLSSIGSFGDALECSSSMVSLQCDEKEAYKDVKSGNFNISKQHSRVASFDYNTIQCGFGEADLLEHINLSACKCKCDRLLPAELIDLSTNATQGSCSTEEQDHQIETIDSPLQIVTQTDLSKEAALHFMDESTEKASHGDAECLDIGTGESKHESVLNAKKLNLVDEAIENLIDMQEARYGDYTEASVMEAPFDPPANQEEENGFRLLVEQIEPKILIGSEESEHAANLPQAKEPVPPAPVLQEDQSTITENVVKNDNVPESDTTKSNLVLTGANQMERNTMENKIISSDKNQEGTSNCLSVDLDLNEAEYEKVPDMPLESLNPLDKKLARFEKRESGADESLDGSVTSETEIRDPVKTIEQLKASLEAERKALNGLYAELEEERSASAIAANQTMAMITRLQEEKAAMQMEALQYQRMMEEQSEYDQEALQLLNELMVKREKEKQELEKELETCRKKILDFEAKEKMRMRGSKDGSVQSKSSVSCSNMEDGDELSIDLNREARDEDGSFYGHGESSSDHNPAEVVQSLEEMALDCVKHISVLDDSLTEYEEERLSILDQLKVLEEKLLTIADKEFIEDVKAIRHSSTYEVNCDSSCKEENEVAEENSQERETMVSMAKNLLPLLDAAENETDEEMLHEIQLEAESFEMQEHSTSKVDLDSNRIAIIEEVDRVYERLQALEEDREFLKHCVGSIKKGDKGMDLLQEILQHLRDLRAAELRASDTADYQQD
ncbi:hypothetical protein SLEP1_g12918 [Rubroshorea leprosula]|uniref:GTD-binding domain-containing protein n=1 Tax=Rubroshorea leprosula TaxID=152421 RepID=A0AAV5IM23_9ROSI|nr:hypothetical protein SLEP1_g12918 [Rubroshorea leprosula]